MKDNEFDSLVRGRIEGATFEAPDVWPQIVKKMERRRRMVIMRRVSFATVAAAACIAAALFIFRDRTPVQAPTAPEQTAKVETVAPIEEQIAEFTSTEALAQNLPVKTAHKPAVKPVEPSVNDEEPVAQETIEEDTKVEVEEETGQEAKEDIETGKPAETVTGDNRLGQEDIPADFWEEPRAASGNHTTHTSQISILSNLTTVASGGNSIFEAVPSHASSQSGSRQASSPVAPFSESPKFFAPVSLGVQFAVPLSDRLSVATGVSYSYLVSQYDILVDAKRYTDAYNQLHYVGVPLMMSYHFVQTPSFGFYASTGGALEKCVSQRYVYGGNTLHEKVTGLQASVHLGLGAEYWFASHAGIYFDPSLVYYFDNKQPLSIRTQQPLQARFEIGFRFRL